METGLFITLEGVDGCGKSTQASMLADHFRERGRAVVHTREPGGTVLGEKIRDVFLRGESEISGMSEMMLMGADRSHHVETLIRPALQNGQVVVCERFADSSVAYQGFGRQLDLDAVHMINDLATGGLSPDITFLLDMSPEEALSRRLSSSDRIEAEHITFFDAVRKGYLHLAQTFEDRIVVIDASKSIDEVQSEILTVVSSGLPLR